MYMSIHDIKFIKLLFLHYLWLNVNHIAMVTLSTRKRNQSHHASVGNKYTNTQSWPSSTANCVQFRSTTNNEQLKSISVTSSVECSYQTNMSVHNQQRISNMESEIAKIKQKNATLLAQQQQQQQQQ